MAPQRIRVGDLDVCFALEGPAQAPVVLLVHGILTSHRMWDGVADELVDRWRVLRYDLRGHGGTTTTPGPYTLAQLADDAVGLLDALGLDRVHAVGSSLGGMVGQRLGAEAGSRLQSLTLANTTAVQAAPAVWQQRIDIARSQGVAPLVAPTLQRWFTPGCFNTGEATVGRMSDLARATSAEGYAGCAAAVRDLSQADLLGRIDLPTLVIVGEHDGATTPAEGRHLQQGIAGARWVVLPAAHQSAVECPRLFAQAWAAFAGRPATSPGAPPPFQ